VYDAFTVDLLPLRPQGKKWNVHQIPPQEIHRNDGRYPPSSLWACQTASLQRTTNACKSFHSTRRFNDTFYKTHPDIFITCAIYRVCNFLSRMYCVQFAVCAVCSSKCTVCKLPCVQFAQKNYRVQFTVCADCSGSVCTYVFLIIINPNVFIRSNDTGQNVSMGKILDLLVGNVGVVCTCYLISYLITKNSCMRRNPYESRSTFSKMKNEEGDYEWGQL